MDPTTLRLDEASARRLVLVRAIDDVDTEGRLLSSVERDRLEQEALEASRESSPPSSLDRASYLQQRAHRLLAAVEHRHPQLTALEQPGAWRRWLAWLLPLAACVLGAAIDRIDNPQRVNMLSPPLLAVLLWNLLAYAGLVVAWFLPRRWAEASPLAALQQWLAREPRIGARPGRLRRDVLARFQQQWLRTTGPQQVLWGKQVLHATAAGWAVGLALSIALGGVVREYRVGWESTLLELHQVHTFLSVLFAPVVALLPLEGFSLADLQRMRFSSGAAIGVEEARRWVGLYLGLLLLVVVLPRAVLAAVAGWRARRLGRAVAFDLRDPYFVQVLARVSPARVTVGVLAFDEDARVLLLQAMRQAAGRVPPTRLEAPWTVLATPKGDALRLFDIPLGTRPPTPVAPALASGPSPARAWLQDLMGRFRSSAPAPRGDALTSALQEADLVLLLPAQPEDLQAASRLLHWLDRPALVLVGGGDEGADELAAYRAAVRRAALPADVLALRDCTGNWSRDALLLDAITGRLPQGKRAGFARMAEVWNERNVQRLDDAMQLVADLLLQAARDTEAAGGSLSLKRLVSTGDREAGQRLRQAAQDAMVLRLREAEATHLAELMRMYGVDEALPTAPAALTGERFTVQAPLDSPQAGMAGAATGAAMGAGIDLVTGGLTLGAATALGAMLGGGAAYVAAAWRNRGGSAGTAQVQLSDEMMQSLAEAALLRYLAVVHRSRGGPGLAAATPPAWRSEVVAAVEGARESFAEFWRQVRASGDAASLRQPLAAKLNALVRQVLARL
ncbi:DUF3482 domain-containing protein [Caenimonas sedimenti]|uniref:DUF3482 domain-containing protein n=1 Tax=Caenimonas sedimenti TaxID=2596921 RepID=A0A562ZP30_9BURK|nr:DUF3482 domain-containing protein [Caenimonas sedimenti]TWO69914.1 DUF3482 domain-containing protein [Caenimonas sedimenti]